MGALTECQERHEWFALHWNSVAKQCASTPLARAVILHSKQAHILWQDYLWPQLMFVAKNYPWQGSVSYFLPKKYINFKELPLALFYICGSSDITRVKGVCPGFSRLPAGLKPWQSPSILSVSVVGRWPHAHCSWTLQTTSQSFTGPVQDGFLANIMQATVHT